MPRMRVITLRLLVVVIVSVVVVVVVVVAVYLGTQVSLVLSTLAKWKLTASCAW